MDREKTYELIGKENGIDKCMDLLIEECGELISSIIKFRRLMMRTDKEFIPITKEDSYLNLLEELTDVYICIRTLEKASNDTIKPNDIILDYKLKRILNRLGLEDKENANLTNG